MSSVFGSHPVITDMCYGKRCLVVCTLDRGVYIYTANTDKLQHFNCSTNSYCVATHNNDLFVGTDTNALEIHAFQGDVIENRIDFSTPVSALFLNEPLMFVGTKGGKLIMLNVDDKLKNTTDFDEHDGAILAINVNHNNKWLATSSCDGYVRIYNIDQKVLIKKLNLIDKSDDIKNSVCLCKIQWDTIEQVLLIPVKESIFFYDSNGFKRREQYYKAENQSYIDFVKFSICSKFLLIMYRNGELFIIDRFMFKLFYRYSTISMVCGLCFNPMETTVVTYSTIAGDIVHLQLMSSLSEEEQLLSFDTLMGLNTDNVKNKLNYLIIYFLWYLMTKNVHLLTDKGKTIDSYVNNRKNGYTFEKKLKNLDLSIKIFQWQHELIILSENKETVFTSTINIGIEKNVHEQDGKFSLKNSPDLTQYLERKTTPLLDFINTNQDDQGNDRQVKIINEQRMRFDSAQFTIDVYESFFK